MVDVFTSRKTKDTKYLINNRVYFSNPFKKIMNTSGCLPGITNLFRRDYSGSYAFHAMRGEPKGNELVVGYGAHRKNPDHTSYLWAYSNPKNNINGGNNTPEAERHIREYQTGFYYLVFQTRYGAERVIRLGSESQEGNLCVLSGDGFHEIFRYITEGVKPYYFVHQLIHEVGAKIIDIIPITPEISSGLGIHLTQIYEPVDNLGGIIPLTKYLSSCSRHTASKICDIANALDATPPIELPKALEPYV